MTEPEFDEKKNNHPSSSVPSDTIVDENVNLVLQNDKPKKMFGGRKAKAVEDEPTKKKNETIPYLQLYRFASPFDILCIW